MQCTKESCLHNGLCSPPLKNESQDSVSNKFNANASTLIFTSTNDNSECGLRERLQRDEESLVETLMRRRAIVQESLDIGLVHTRQNPPRDLLPVLLPVLSVLPHALLLIPQLSVNE